MGQLDILTAQSVATERQSAAVRDAHHRQLAAGRTVATTVRPAGSRWVPTLLARVGLTRPASA